MSFIHDLSQFIDQRFQEKPEGSYTTTLFEAGLPRMAQKVGEEGVEVALAAVAQDTETLKNESADLLYHLIVLLRAKGLDFADIEQVLSDRHQ